MARLLLHEIRSQQLLFWRNYEAAFFTFALPIRRVVRHMQTYAEAPEDARRVIEPNADVAELRVAEEALQSMQVRC